MRFRFVLYSVTLLLLGQTVPAAPAAPKNTLDIYFIDVEGGAATLIVAPSGQSLLSDAGWRRADNRDPQRIYDVATRQAGLKKIDYALVTHYHMDHVGGMAGLSKLMPVGEYIDHGARVETTGGDDGQNWSDYQGLAKAGKRVIVKPGDHIPLTGVDVTVVASNGELISHPINGGGPNAALCKDARVKEADPTENARSVGFLASFGKFQFLVLGDLTWNKESELACPQNLVGQIDLLQVTHHGMDMSGAPQHIWAIRPQVAIIDNGPHKGGTAVVYDTLKNSPGIQDIWQGHRALDADTQHNTAETMIANLGTEEGCQGYSLKVSVDPDGRYTVTNSRNGFSKTYHAR